jgi:hypothetical protein
MHEAVFHNIYKEPLFTTPKLQFIHFFHTLVKMDIILLHIVSFWHNFTVTYRLDEQKYPPMKRYIFLIISSFFALSVAAQKQEVISSAGGYFTATGINISWTLGETIIPSYGPTNGLILTHGFQSVLRTVIVEENIETPVEVTVYPNPASDYLNISFTEPPDTQVDLYLFDTNGKLFKNEVIEPLSPDKQINFQDLPAGVYFLKLIKGKLSNVYKVIKL